MTGATQYNLGQITVLWPAPKIHSVVLGSRISASQFLKNCINKKKLASTYGQGKNFYFWRKRFVPSFATHKPSCKQWYSAAEAPLRHLYQWKTGPANISENAQQTSGTYKIATIPLVTRMSNSKCHLCDETRLPLNADLYVTTAT